MRLLMRLHIESYSPFKDKTPEELDQIVEDLWNFLLDHLKVHLRQKGHKPDVIDAVLSQARQPILKGGRER